MNAKHSFREVMNLSESFRKEISLWPLMKKSKKSIFIVSVRELLEKAYELEVDDYLNRNEVVLVEEIIDFWEDFLIDVKRYRSQPLPASSDIKRISGASSSRSDAQKYSSVGTRSIRYIVPEGMTEKYFSEVAKLSQSPTTGNKVSEERAKPTIPTDPRLVAIYKKLSKE